MKTQQGPRLLISRPTRQEPRESPYTLYALNDFLPHRQDSCLLLFDLLLVVDEIELIFLELVSQDFELLMFLLEDLEKFLVVV